MSEHHTHHYHCAIHHIPHHPRRYNIHTLISRPQTIGVILVAYHETSCIGAIETALSLAKNPHRLYFFIVNAGATNAKKSCLNGYNDFQSGTGSTIVTNFIKSISEIHSEFYGPNAAKSELIQKEIA
eukprot:1038076_1